jgi:hypothetical protein
MNHRSMNRSTAQNPLQPASSRNPKSRPEPTVAARRPFIEDFNMEHCCSGVTAALMAFSASSDPAEAGTPRKAYAPPSCVYLG